MFAELVPIILPVYLCAAVGFGWARSGRHFDSEMAGDLTMNLSAPCLIFSTLSHVEVDPSAMLEMVGATLMALMGFAVIGAVVLRATGQSISAFLGPMVFPNAGNMGLAICLFAFGDVGLTYGICFFAVVSLVHFTVGQWIWSGVVSFSQILKTPLAYGAVAGALVVGMDWTVPEWLDRTTSIVGGLAIPLMQLTLGVSLGQLGLASLPRSFALALLRLAIGVSVGFGVAALLGLEGVARGVIILDCAMPVAVVNYLFAQRFDRQPAEVASVVLVSTLLAFVTVPLLLAFVL